MTRDRATAVDWLTRFEGAGLDGVIAKLASGTYLPGKRAMIKVKHARTAECVVAGFRWHKSGKDAVGSLLLGLYDDHGVLQHVGVTSSFTMATRRQLAKELGTASQKCNGGSSVARVGRRCGRVEPHAGRAKSLERRERTSRGSRCASSASAK